jgi:Transposase
MLGFRQRASREERREWWRGQLTRQQSANVSVAEFCRQLGVSVATFYYWKRRVDEVPPTATGQASTEQPSRSRNGSAGATTPNFVPVSILEPTAGTQLEVELTNACVVRLKGVIDPSLLQAAITAAGQLDGSREGAN